MAYKRLSIISLSVLSLALAGCSSGGGGGGSTPGGTTYLTWADRIAAAEQGETISLEGTSIEGEVTVDSDGNFQFSDITQGDAKLEADESAIKFTAAGGTVLQFSDEEQDLEFPLGGTDVLAVTLDRADNGDFLIFVDPFVEGFEYQSFGVWGRLDETTGRGVAGAFSVGSKTAVADIPTTGSATFVGSATGIYAVGDNARLTAAKMTADVSFATRTVAFSTSNTQAGGLGEIIGSQPGSPGWHDRAGLDLSGTLSYAAGSNNITGDVRSADGMTGAAAASFYGPNAAEVGGTFAVGEGTTRRFFGGFGGKR